MINKIMNNTLKYIREYCEDYLICDYGINPDSIKTDQSLCAKIWEIFNTEIPDGPRYSYDIQRFKDWAQGLAMGGLFCYYYNRNAKDDLHDIVGGDVPDKMDEQRAEEVLTRYIYLAIVKTMK